MAAWACAAEADRLEWEGERVEARSYYARALANHERRGRESLAVAACLSALGRVALRDEDFVAAGAHFARAASLRDTLAPQGAAAAWSRADLALLSYAGGDLAGATEQYRRFTAAETTLPPAPPGGRRPSGT